jgi:hypothetical protein
MKALPWAFALACLVIWGAAAEPISPDRICVLDGDTIRIDGQKPDGLVGFNAPETWRAKNPSVVGTGRNRPLAI